MHACTHNTKSVSNVIIELFKEHYQFEEVKHIFNSPEGYAINSEIRLTFFDCIVRKSNYENSIKNAMQATD